MEVFIVQTGPLSRTRGEGGADRWQARVARLADVTRQQAVELVEQDPAFAFREAARFVRDRVIEDVPGEIAEKAVTMFYPAVRVASLALDVEKARRTFADAGSGPVDRTVDASHVITDAVGVVGLVVLALPGCAAATGIGSTLAAVAVAGDITAYGFHLLRFVRARTGDPGQVPLRILGNGEPPPAASNASDALESADSLLVPCALLSDGRLVPASSLLGGYHGSSRVMPGEAFTRGLPSPGQDHDALSPLKDRAGSELRIVSGVVADPAGDTGAADEAGEGGWVYELAGVPTWDLASTLEAQASLAFHHGVPMVPVSQGLVPGEIPSEAIVRAGRVERLASGRLAVRHWIDNPNYRTPGPAPAGATT